MTNSRFNHRQRVTSKENTSSPKNNQAQKSPGNFKHEEAAKERDEIETCDSTAVSNIEPLNKKQIKKLHLQLRHGAKTAIEIYIRAAGVWHSSIATVIENVFEECKCRESFPPVPHTKVAVRPPLSDPQERICKDVIHLDGKNFLHSVEECTSWSEAGYIARKKMVSQIALLHRMHHMRHGAPKRIWCDREYDNNEFKEVCRESDTELIIVAAKLHEANRLI